MSLQRIEKIFMLCPLERVAMAVKITYFVHGTTTDNERGLATGWSPGELSERGKQESRELGRLVRGERFDAVFTSDLQRAVDSARLTFNSGYQVIQDKRLREANYGDFTGCPSSSFKKDFIKYVDTPFPLGESLRDVEHRLNDFLTYLCQNYQGKHVAIVAHQAPQLAIEVLVNKKTWQQAIETDWREKDAWQPGWTYVLD
jgi:broad specificity phosphatase PhoE